MRACVVDRLLARLDGEVAPIWVTLLLELDDEPPEADMRRAAGALVAETPRLQIAWREPEGGWVPRPLRAQAIDAVVEMRRNPEPYRVAVDRALATGVDLGRDVPLRIRATRVTDGPAPWLLALQLHHAIGDARAFGQLLGRWLGHMRRAPEGTPLGLPALTGRRVVGEVARRLPHALGAARRHHLLLQRRGMSLRRDGDDVEAPMLCTARIPLGGATGMDASGVFFAALLAGIVLHQGTAASALPVRLRVPVDLRRELEIRRTLETPCSAIAVELDLEEMRARMRQPEALADLARSRIAGAVRDGLPWATLLEVALASRFASRERLRRGARPGLLAPPLSATMVLTYVGDVDRYFRACPMPIRAMRGHTPTWGATGFSYRDVLSVNVAAFEGLWRRDTLRTFVESLGDWVTQNLGLSVEVIGP